MAVTLRTIVPGYKGMILQRPIDGWYADFIINYAVHGPGRYPDSHQEESIENTIRQLKL